MSKTKEWVSYPEAISSFSEKYASGIQAKSIFWHCVEEGFIKTRIWNGKPRSIKIHAAFRRYIEDNCIINPSLWTDMNDDSLQTNYDESKFNFVIDEWEDEKRCTFEGVEFYRKDILHLFSRAGVGGRPFQKRDWMQMTLEVLEMALNNRLSNYSTKSELQEALYVIVNGGADDDQLKQATFDRPTQEIWQTYQRYLEKTKS